MQYAYEVAGDSRLDLVIEANQKASEFFGKRDHVVEILTVRLNDMPGKTYCADVTASEIQPHYRK